MTSFGKKLQQDRTGLDIASETKACHRRTANIAIAKEHQMLLNMILDGVLKLLLIRKLADWSMINLNSKKGPVGRRLWPLHPHLAFAAFFLLTDILIWVLNPCKMPSSSWIFADIRKLVNGGQQHLLFRSNYLFLGISLTGLWGSLASWLFLCSAWV